MIGGKGVCVCVCVSMCMDSTFKKKVPQGPYISYWNRT